MKVELELWHLIVLLLAFFSCVAVFGKILLDQFEKRQAERFDALDQARVSGSALLRETLERHLDQEKVFQKQLADLERDFLTWRGELPLNYVRREDHIRMQTIIEAKLDGLALKIENQQLKGAL